MHENVRWSSACPIAVRTYARETSNVQRPTRNTEENTSTHTNRMRLQIPVVSRSNTCVPARVQCLQRAVSNYTCFVEPYMFLTSRVLAILACLIRGAGHRVNRQIPVECGHLAQLLSNKKQGVCTAVVRAHDSQQPGTGRLKLREHAGVHTQSVDRTRATNLHRRAQGPRCLTCHLVLCLSRFPLQLRPCFKEVMCSTCAILDLHRTAPGFVSLRMVFSPDFSATKICVVVCGLVSVFSLSAKRLVHPVIYPFILMRATVPPDSF